MSVFPLRLAFFEGFLRMSSELVRWGTGIQGGHLGYDFLAREFLEYTLQLDLQIGIHVSGFRRVP